MDVSAAEKQLGVAAHSDPAVTPCRAGHPPVLCPPIPSGREGGAADSPHLAEEGSGAGELVSSAAGLRKGTGGSYRLNCVPAKTQPWQDRQDLRV